MTVARSIGISLGVLAVMLAVVMIRAETARLQYEASRLDQQQAALRLQARENELAIVRLKNPAVILDRAKELYASDAPPARPPGRPAPRKPGESRPKPGGR